MPYHNRVNQGKIWLGLSHLQAFPRDFAYWIVEKRPFADFIDFVRKCPEKFQKADYYKVLIQIGAFDSMEQNRGKLLFNVENLLAYVQNIQLDLFGNSQLKFTYQQAEDLTQAEKYELEQNYLGIGITPHPLKTLAQHFQGNFTELNQLEKNRRASILVELLYIRTHRAKNGQNMAFLTVSDTQEKLDVTLFPETYREYADILEKGKFYFISGKVGERNENLQLLADRMAPAEMSERKLWLNVLDASRNAKISQILHEFPGSHQVILHLADQKVTRQTNVYVAESDQLKKRLTGYVQASVYK